MTVPNRIDPAVFVRAAAGLHGFLVASLMGPYKASGAICDARADAVAMGLDAGYSRAEMARALGLDWASVDALAKRETPRR
jgi:hypothetical protein